MEMTDKMTICVPYRTLFALPEISGKMKPGKDILFAEISLSFLETQNVARKNVAFLRTIQIEIVRITVTFCGSASDLSQK